MKEEGEGKRNGGIWGKGEGKGRWDPGMYVPYV